MLPPFLRIVTHSSVDSVPIQRLYKSLVPRCFSWAVKCVATREERKCPIAFAAAAIGYVYCIHHYMYTCVDSHRMQSVQSRTRREVK